MTTDTQTISFSHSAPSGLPWRLALVLLIFVWFPLTGVWLALSHLLGDQEKAWQERMDTQLDAQLDEAERFDDQNLFWSRICRQIDLRLKTHADGMTSVKAEIARLRRVFPGVSFGLVVWNAQNQLVHTDSVASLSVSDWTVIRQDLIREVPAARMRDQSQAPYLLGSAWSRLFVGGFMSSRVINLWPKNKQLLMPLGQRDPAALWWQRFSSFSYLLHVGSTAFQEPVGLRYFHRYLRPRLFPGLRFGYFDPQQPEASSLETDVREEFLAGKDLTRSLVLPRVSHERWLATLRQFPSGLVAFAAAPKPGLILYRQLILMSVGLFLLVLACSLTRSGRRRWSGEDQRPISLRWKLGFLFLFANGLPLILLGMVGSRQLRHQELSLINEAKQSCAALIRQFDDGFTLSLERSRRQALQRLDGLQSRLAARPANEEDITFLQDLRSQYIFVASDSGDVISNQGFFSGGGATRKNGIRSIPRNLLFLRDGIQSILRVLNGTPASPAGIGKFELVIEALYGMTFGEFSNLILSGVSRLTFWGDGTKTLPTVLRLFRFPGSNNYDYLLMGQLPSGRLSQIYIRDGLQALNRNRLGLRFFSRSRHPIAEDYAKTSNSSPALKKKPPKIVQFPPDISLPREVVRYAGALGPLVSVSPEPVRIRGRSYLIMGCQGRNLNAFNCFALYPYERIQTRLSQFRQGLLAFSLFNLLLTLLLGQAMARRFLEPISVLYDGTQAMVRREFTRRLPDLGSDEFGHIGHSFNVAMESLEGLAVARIVQENLLPKSVLTTGMFQVYGRSIAMSELGGDFFDILPRGDQRFVLALGDVTGHGVPAALMMAMAKTALFRMVRKNESVSSALQGLNGLFHQMRDRNSRRMMSLQTVEFEDGKSVVRVTNAGHCHPVHIRGQSGTLVKILSTPVGITLRHRFEPCDVVMEPGDALVLYTDGAVELTDPNDQPMDFDGFARLATHCYHRDPMQFYHRLTEGLREFSGFQKEAQDDLTILILLRRDTGANSQAV